MEQVTEAELLWAVKYRLSRLSKTLRNNLASHNHASHDYAVQAIAETIVKEALGHFEILTSTPRSQAHLFPQAAYGTGNGRAPAYEDEADSPTDDGHR